MGSQNLEKRKKIRANGNRKSHLQLWIAFCTISVAVLGYGTGCADTLDYLAPWSIGSEFMYSWIWGTMSYDQGACCGFGTTNQLRDDLGLPQDNQTYRVYATIRPLEHHMLRVFGSVPELYQSQNILQKDLRLTQLPGVTITGIYHY